MELIEFWMLLAIPCTLLCKVVKPAPDALNEDCSLEIESKAVASAVIAAAALVEVVTFSELMPKPDIVAVTALTLVVSVAAKPVCTTKPAVLPVSKFEPFKVAPLAKLVICFSKLWNVASSVVLSAAAVVLLPAFSARVCSWPMMLEIELKPDCATLITFWAVPMLPAAVL